MRTAPIARRAAEGGYWLREVCRTSSIRWPISRHQHPDGRPALPSNIGHVGPTLVCHEIAGRRQKLSQSMGRRWAAKVVAEAQPANIKAGTRAEVIAARKAAHEQAQAGVILAQKTYDRVSQLAEHGNVPTARLDHGVRGPRSAKSVAHRSTRAETIVLVNPQRNYAQFLLRALLPVVVHVIFATP